MLNIIYLTYQKNYDFISDVNFIDWISQIDKIVGIGEIYIIDNMRALRPTETYTWRDTTVTTFAGDNSAREFSGYQVGLSKLQNIEGITLLLNDTFLQQKHQPWDLLLPAVLSKIKNPRIFKKKQVIGEINRGPIGSKYDGLPIKWISTYCIIFSNLHIKAVKKAVASAENSFAAQDIKLNSVFISHIKKQISDLHKFKDPKEKIRKLQATEAEMAFSRTLKSSGVSLFSIYSATSSPIIYARYTINRIKRKFKFLTRN